METRYLAIYRLPGILALPADTDIELLKSSDGARVFLTTRQAEFIEHIKKRAALGVMFASIFAIPGQESAVLRPAAERFAEALALVRVQPEVLAAKVLLVVEVAGSEANPELEHLVDLGPVGTRLEIFDEHPYVVAAENALRTAFAGLSLALPDHATDSILSVGSVAYVIEPDTDRLLYSTSIKVSGSMTSSIHLPQSVANEAVTIVKALYGSGLDNSVRLLSQSSEGHRDRLMAFLSAWTALELFVQKVFASTYGPNFYAQVASATPASAAIFLDRIEEVMSDKYNVRHKFVAIASALSPVEAVADTALFAKLKKRRDELAHTMKDDPSTLPADAARDLLREYLRLHLASTAS